MNRDDDRIIEGMKRQAEAREVLLAEGSRLGWKSGFGTEGGMALLKIEQPLTGSLTTATQIDSGSTVDVTDWTTPLFEAEVAVRLDSAVGPGASPEEGAGSIGGIAAAIELVDLGAIDSVSDILAGNIFHRKVILGEFVELREGGLESIRIAVTANGEKADPADPREVIGDIGKVVASLADQAELLGDSFRPGDVVITGAAVPPAQLRSGDAYEVEVTGAGGVSVSIA